MKYILVILLGALSIHAQACEYGHRYNSDSCKGSGYFGVLHTSNGNIATEIGIGVVIGGKEVEIPSLVPTLTKMEIDYLLHGNAPTKYIVRKATKHAIIRMRQGLSPFVD